VNLKHLINTCAPQKKAVNVRNPAWTGDGQEILFVSDEPGRDPPIWRIPAFHAADPRPVNHMGKGSSSVTLSPQKNRPLCSKETEDANIWCISLDPASSAIKMIENFR
jgi:Tol biopolymer transport system component